MTIEEIRERILHDDEFVLSELKKLQYLYGLQRVIRSNLTRNEDIKTESVADHIFALGILATYFSQVEMLPKLDMYQVQQLITWHDIDEIETGDTIGYLKIVTESVDEESILSKVIDKSPSLLHKHIHKAICEYKAQKTIESRFVKALDKIDPIIYFLNENGKKVFEVSPATKEQHCRIKEPYLQDFPYIKRFHEVTLPIFEKQGYFAKESHF